MSETQTAAAGEYNPFDPENQSQGGGLWDGKTVTITGATVIKQALVYGAKKGGGPVIDKETGQQSILTALSITGITEGGGSDKERKEEYSVGGKVDAQDGGFVMKDGGPLKFHATSNFGKFSAALKASGFNIGLLLVRDAAGAIVYIAPGVPRQDYSKLVGARFVFKAEAKSGKDGKAIKDDKGYDKSAHFPAKYLGIGCVAAKPAGNGAASAPAGALETKAVGAVLAALAKAPGTKLTRAELIRTLANDLGPSGSNDPNCNEIVTLVVNEQFHSGKAWRYDAKESVVSL